MSAGRATLRRGIRFARRVLRAASSPPPAAPLPVRDLWATGEAEAERWNEEWLHYLGREWRLQLEHHSAWPETPPLPETALELLEHTLGRRPSLQLYAEPDRIEGQRVMELGCGCGNLGKLLGRYASSYVGVDFSPLALQIARLVSPPSCTYALVSERSALEPLLGTRDAVVGRYFFIHQNLELARRVLDYAVPFLEPGGRLYADFYWPDPDRAQGVVFDPEAPLSAKYPSALFRYDRAAVDRLVAGRPLRVVREELHPRMQRRFVTLERDEA